MFKRHIALLVLIFFLAPAMVSGEESGQETDQQTSAGCGGEARQDGLFSYDGKHYRLQDLDTNVQQSMYDLKIKQFRERELILDNALWQLHIANEAKQQQKDKNKLARELLKLKQPEEADLNAFYQANKAQIPAPYEKVKPQLVNYLLQQQIVRNRTRLINGLKKQGRYEILAARPQPPIAIIDTEGFPSSGSPLAPVELVEFADYQCPHCKTASEAVSHLKKQFGEQLRVVFMDFPINRSGISAKVAEGAVCADQQNAFWPYHEGAFAIQSSLSNQTPQQLAERLKLDLEQFSRCMQDGKTARKVARSKAEALRLGLDSTPSFYVNGIRTVIQQDIEQDLIKAVDKALQESGS